MENQANINSLLLIRKYKSQGTGFLLALLFGGLGVLYASAWGILIFVIEFIIGFMVGSHIAEVNKANLYTSYMGITSGYDLGPYWFALSLLRAIALTISYSTIGSHNEKIDKEILALQSISTKSVVEEN